MFDFNKDSEQENTDKVIQKALHTATNMAKGLEGFINKIDSKGLGRPEIIADGEIHRFQTPNDSAGNKSGWYVYFDDNIPAGSFGSWKEDINETYISSGFMGDIQKEQDYLRAVAKKAKQKREEERIKRHNFTACIAQKLWGKGQEVTSHAYLQKKGVQNLGLRQLGKALLVPLFNEAGELRSVQRIFPDGKKFYLKDGEKNGCFFCIHGNGNHAFICEGYATGASLYMATGNTVFICLDSGNLPHVAKIVKKNMPMASIVIAADNDQFTYRNNMPCNVGIEKARSAAQEVGASVVYPTFIDLSTKPTDFNDLYLLEGIEAVKYQTSVSNDAPNLFSWGIDIFKDKAPPVKWLVQDIMPSASPCLLSAQGGTGKGMLTLDLALSIAEEKSLLDLNPRKWLGKDVVDSGTAVIFSAEDSKDSIHQRLDQIDPTGERRKKAKGNLFIIPLPNAGGPIQLVTVKGFNKGGGYKISSTFESIKKQLKSIPNLKFVNFDPLASFVGVDINSDPQAGAFVQGVLANLAEELQAVVFISHHMNKPNQKGGIKNAEDARNAIRGTSALVDGVRSVFAIWNATEEIKKKVRAENKKIRPTDIFECAVVKSNGKADTSVKTLVRSASGLLEIIQVKVEQNTERSIEGLIVEAVKTMAEIGRPFTKSGANGLYARREDLPEELRSLGFHKTNEIMQKLLEEERIVASSYKQRIGCYLDVIGGPFADGNGQIEPGYTKTKKPDFKDSF